MAFVHHPNGKAAVEIVAGRVVRFGEHGVAEVTVPHLLEHYDRAGYAVSRQLDEPGPVDFEDRTLADPPTAADDLDDVALTDDDA
jgi:hypothetical protein